MDFKYPEMSFDDVSEPLESIPPPSTNKINTATSSPYAEQQQRSNYKQNSTSNPVTIGYESGNSSAGTGNELGSWWKSVSENMTNTVSGIVSNITTASENTSSTTTTHNTYVSVPFTIENEEEGVHGGITIEDNTELSRKERIILFVKKMWKWIRDRVVAFWNGCAPWRDFISPSQFSIPSWIEGLSRIRHNAVFFWGNYTVLCYAFMALTIYQNPWMFVVFAVLGFFLSSRIGSALRSEDSTFSRRLTGVAFLAFVIMLLTGVGNAIIGAFTTALFFCLVHAVFHVPLEPVQNEFGIEMHPIPDQQQQNPFTFPFSIPQINLPSFT
eukprot:CAMPEP_0182441370 /NCGR_PEP_ID=MMETSP1172-20130603/301_1 /TAXON_ID=708627 /ORGANISM="Timspurckia oligopyrenoides, Strain CCMP3278" /LENGTH=326 /DNA_ID=CAMNT_0024635579 /DNA_START=173 /DNA_END=1153 /DNA_ORIENTATION=+